jgi:hypothetical protein
MHSRSAAGVAHQPQFWPVRRAVSGAVNILGRLAASVILDNEDEDDGDGRRVGGSEDEDEEPRHLQPRAATDPDTNSPRPPTDGEILEKLRPPPDVALAMAMRQRQLLAQQQQQKGGGGGGGGGDHGDGGDGGDGSPSPRLAPPSDVVVAVAMAKQNAAGAAAAAGGGGEGGGGGGDTPARNEYARGTPLKAVTARYVDILNPEEDAV